MQPLVPCLLVYETSEYKHAAMTQKSSFTSMHPAQQCIYLAHVYKKPFEYEDSVDFVFNTIEKRWDALVWDPKKKIISDIIVSIDLEFESENAKNMHTVLLAKNTSEEIQVTVSENGEVPIPLCGIPNVALQYTSLCLYMTGNSPKSIVVRRRILPKALRRRTAQISHDIGNYIIMSGYLAHKNSKSQCVLC